MKRNLIFIFLFIAIQVGAQNTLRFKDGKFKIVQFTDLHWKEVDTCKVYNDSTVLLVQKIIGEENPDLVVLTGDIVVAGDADQGWKTLIGTLNEGNTPFVITFGNHDTETNLTKRQQLELVMKESLNLTQNSGDFVDGVGNCHVSVKGEKDDGDRWILYFMDSQSYTGDSKNLGYYDWIKGSQVEWYRKVSGQYKLQNNKTLPALAFFHIPLPEYKIVKNNPETIGNKLENISSPKINSGLFSAFLEQKDVLGAFVGHDHNNDFIGVTSNIALAFGRKTGYVSAYEELLERGGRVIILDEDEASMETYIRTLDGAEFPFSYAR